MARFLGHTLPPTKNVWIALTEVYGLGYSRARELCFRIGATPQTKASELRPFHLSQLYSAVEAEYVVGDDLRDVERSAIDHLVRIRSYRGMRHLQRLPVRGQRTHSNARTQKKMRRASWAGGHGGRGAGGV